MGLLENIHKARLKWPVDKLPGSNLFIPKAVHRMIIDHSCCLHVGVKDRGAEEFKTAFLHIFGQGLCLGSHHGKLFDAFPPIANCFAADKTPDVF